MSFKAVCPRGQYNNDAELSIMPAPKGCSALPSRGPSPLMAQPSVKFILRCLDPPGAGVYRFAAIVVWPEHVLDRVCHSPWCHNDVTHSSVHCSKYAQVHLFKVNVYYVSASWVL